MSDQKPLIGIAMGSTSDTGVMEGCFETLDELKIPYEVKVTSAHRTPENTRVFAENAAERGLEVIIAGAGWAAPGGA